MKPLNEIYKLYISKKKLNAHWLEKNHFYWSRIFSDADNPVYFHRFTVWNYGNAGVIEAEIRIDINTGNIRLGCYDGGSRSLYASWYSRDIGNSDVVKKIDEKIIDKFKELGIKGWE